MRVDQASIDGSFSTKQVLDLGNDEPDTPQGPGGELDLGGFEPSSDKPKAPKKQAKDENDDLC